MKKCPFCAEEIQDEAIKCRHCGSMVDGKAEIQPVKISQADPFAAYHTDIAGKKEGELTPIGKLGIGLGILFIVASCGATITGDNADPMAGFFGFLWGVGFIIASYLWARRPAPPNR